MKTTLLRNLTEATRRQYDMLISASRLARAEGDFETAYTLADEAAEVNEEYQAYLMDLVYSS